MNPELLRKSLKLAVAAFLTAAIASYCQRIEFVWYPLLAVVVVVDDNDEQTIAAARSRILGTVTGGLVTFLVHTILGGWPGVMLSILLMVPVLRALGWQSGLSTAALVSVMFLMLPSHAELNWQYVINRAVDTSVGCAVALVVGLLFWPRNRLRLLERSDTALRQHLAAQLQGYQLWFEGGAPRPDPLNPAVFSATLERMQGWVSLERGGPHGRELQQLRWRQRLLLWNRIQFHWIQFERLLADVRPAPPLAASVIPLQVQLGPPAARERLGPPGGVIKPWHQAARMAQRPRPYLAVAAELAPLWASLSTLALLPVLPQESRS